MHFTDRYASPLGTVLLAANDNKLIGLWFEKQKYFALCLDREHEEKETPVITLAKRWLDIYFSGKEPHFSVPLHFIGTAFQNEIWGILCSVPYGSTVTYGQVARILAEKRNLPHISAQAVGGAIACNNISVIVPCHRVIGVNGKLTGYAGGVDRKIALLKLERATEK